MIWRSGQCHGRLLSREGNLRSLPHLLSWCTSHLFSFLDVFLLIYDPQPFLTLTLGLMIRPKTENLDVIVNVSDTESWDQHVQKLNKFLERECRASPGP